jgi:hypothetical protein
MAVMENQTCPSSGKYLNVIILIRWDWENSSWINLCCAITVQFLDTDGE